MTRDRIEALDILRGLMALGLMIYHYAGWTGLLEGPAGGLLLKKIGLYGVEIFFCISGFSMFYVYGDMRGTLQDVRAFWLKRFFRIAPLYYGCALVSLGYKHLAGKSVSWGDLAGNFTFTFGVYAPSHSLVVGGWSIGVEMVFYALFPLLLWGVRRPGTRWGLVLLSALALVLVERRLALMEGGMPDLWPSYVAPANHLFFFLLGGLGVPLRKRLGRWPSRAKAAVLLGLVAAFIGAADVHGDEVVLVLGWHRYLYVLLSVGLVWAAAPCAVAAGWVRTSLVWLGDVSYALYLVHPIAYFGVSLVLAKLHLALGPGVAVVAGALTLGLSSLAFRHIEKPGMALGRKALGAMARP